MADICETCESDMCYCSIQDSSDSSVVDDLCNPSSSSDASGSFAPGDESAAFQFLSSTSSSSSSDDYFCASCASFDGGSISAAFVSSASEGSSSDGDLAADLPMHLLAIGVESDGSSYCPHSSSSSDSGSSLYLSAHSISEGDSGAGSSSSSSSYCSFDFFSETSASAPLSDSRSTSFSSLSSLECSSESSSFSDSRSTSFSSLSSLEFSSESSFSAHSCLSRLSSISSSYLPAIFSPSHSLARLAAKHEMSAALNSANMLAARDAAQKPSSGARGCDASGNSLLHIAARADDTVTAGLALARGARPLAHNYDRETPLDVASRAGALGVMRILLGLASVRKHFLGVLDPVCSLRSISLAVEGRQLGAVRLLAGCMRAELFDAAYLWVLTNCVGLAQMTDEDNRPILELLKELGGVPTFMCSQVPENFEYVTHWVDDLGGVEACRELSDAYYAELLEKQWLQRGLRVVTFAQ